MYGLKSDYKARATFSMNRTTAGVVRKWKDGDGNYLWQTSLVAGQPDMLCGYAVDEDSAMDDIGSNTFPVAFGDFMEGYLIVDLGGFRATPDDITTPGYTKFLRAPPGGR